MKKKSQKNLENKKNAVPLHRNSKGSLAQLV